jgi:hypothetical protein
MAGKAAHLAVHESYGRVELIGRDEPPVFQSKGTVAYPDRMFAVALVAYLERLAYGDRVLVA